MAPNFLSTRDAANFLGLKPRTLERWRWAGKGPRFRRHGRRVVYDLDGLLAWSEANEVASTSEPHSGKKASS